MMIFHFFSKPYYLGVKVLYDVLVCFMQQRDG